MGMLILSRRTGQRVFLFLPDGTRIEVVVIERRLDRVRLGFLAPADVEILREELVDGEEEDDGED